MSDDPTFLSLFAGIGGFDLALERTGFRCVGQVELDPFCQRVLALRWPDVPRWADIRAFAHQERDGRRRSVAGTGGGERALSNGFERHPGSHVDLLTGGFPCQGASVAGKRLGLADDRTALFWEIIRIQKIIQAPWALLENVPGLRSVTRGRDFETVLAALTECWPVVGWRTLDSRFFHVPQRRERIFFMCGPDAARVASVLFEPESGAGDPPAGREAGADVARALAVGTGSAGYRFDPNGETYVTALRHLGSGGPDDNEAQGGHLIVSDPVTGSPYADNEAQHRKLIVSGLAATLDQRGRGPTDSVMMNLVTHTLSAEGADASEDGTGRGMPLVAVGINASGLRGRQPGSAATFVAPEMTVRRLTPTECARLQGFPDGWCCLCQPLENWAADPELAADRCRCPDGPQYRAYGNAVTVPVVEWIGRRLRTGITNGR